MFERERERDDRKRQNQYLATADMTKTAATGDLHCDQTRCQKSSNRVSRYTGEFLRERVDNVFDAGIHHHTSPACGGRVRIEIGRVCHRPERTIAIFSAAVSAPDHQDTALLLWIALILVTPRACQSALLRRASRHRRGLPRSPSSSSLQPGSGCGADELAY